MRGSLKASGALLVVDLGEVRRLRTESGPVLARYVAVVRAEAEGRCARPGRTAYGPVLLRHGLPPGETLVYRSTSDPLEFELEDGAVVVGSVAVFPDGPPAFVFTPHYAWVEE